ncbi:MAG: DUF58 domain-containing protein [Pikeienuella sp.]
MRPSRRLLALAFLALAATALAVSLGGGARDQALTLWFVLGVVAVVDFGLSLSRRLRITVTAPAEVFVGEHGQLTIHSETPAHPRASARIDWPHGLDGEADTDLSALANGGPAKARFFARRRGTWQVKQLWLNWPSRLGLFHFTPRVKMEIAIAAATNIRPVTSGQIDVAVRSTLFGVKENLMVGEGSEFHQLRDFTQGMDVRGIDWKRSARHRNLISREMRAERNHHVIIALDNGYLMREELAGLPKIDHAVNAGLAVAWAAALGGDLVGLYAFDARPRLFAPPEPGRTAFARMRSRTAELEYATVETNHTLAMAELSARTPRRSLIVIFSDFVDTTTAELLVENVATLSKRHVIIFVALRDPGLTEMVETSPTDLTQAARAVSAGQMLKERRLVMERLSRLGVVVLDTPPGEVTPRLVSTYLDLKAKEVV